MSCFSSIFCFSSFGWLLSIVSVSILFVSSVNFSVSILISCNCFLLLSIILFSSFVSGFVSIGSGILNIGKMFLVVVVFGASKTKLSSPIVSILSTILIKFCSSKGSSLKAKFCDIIYNIIYVFNIFSI
ncbi:MAG: hypothetical protein CML42_07500 [Rhodobacteraceae bacterium]|nr:hypothetical protein [Paracoccaceae bacterium]